ncbi:ATP-binding protein [Actinocorallia libanotica]|uniref:Histidine kinase/HSP90-like ATPase domain-containing protein n=1 Tax=Actinocorallia libanotica TaxID=46162 RepID=A0ABN1REX1_9ACTN
MSEMTLAPARTICLISQPHAVKRARDEVMASARGWGLSEEKLQHLQLLTSELVTNTLPHAEGQAIEVRTEHRGECVVLDVWDPAPPISKANATLTMPEAMAESGRGLPLVETFSSQWYERPSADRGGKHLIAHIPLVGVTCGCVEEQ